MVVVVVVRRRRCCWCLRSSKPLSTISPCCCCCTICSCSSSKTISISSALACHLSLRCFVLVFSISHALVLASIRPLASCHTACWFADVIASNTRLHALGNTPQPKYRSSNSFSLVFIVSHMYFTNFAQSPLKSPQIVPGISR